jgi:5-methyltetrahydrofolate--homocysteine methyltransferase
MGTMLQNMGLQPGRCPETLNLIEPEKITQIHRSYIEAGAEIVYTNTFGANRYKVRDTGYSVEQLVSAGVACAKEAAKGTSVQVALSLGPIGQLLEPYGTLSFEEAYDIYRELVEAGEQAGADLVVFETQTDLYEVKAAVLAAKEHTTLPVYVTMTFEPGGRTFTGCSISAMAAVLNGLGVDGMGINCSLGPEEILPFARELASLTEKPLVVKANAGLPDPATGVYHIDPDTFARQMAPFVEAGVSYLGGCCGTTPDYIRALIAQTQGMTPAPRQVRGRSVVCTPTKVVEIDGVRIIGERINPTGKKRFKQALLEGDMDYIVRQAVEQADAGAHILDVNVGVPGIDEAEMMVRVVKAIQEVTDLPLQIDSSNIRALEAGLRAVNGKAIINSVNGEADRLQAVLPLAKKYGAAVIGLAMDEEGIPPTAEQRFSIAQRILNAALDWGIPREDVFIDCLTLTVSAQQDKAVETLKAMSMVRDQLGLHCTLGVSNISFGLPRRELITQGFLTLAMAHGLDLPIVNPNSQGIMDAIRVFNVLYNRDKNAEEYIEACAKNPVPTLVAQQPTPQSAPQSVGGEEQHPLIRAVRKGLKEDCRRMTQELLNGGMEEIQVVNTLLIPALDLVGNEFEVGTLFLPQLINSAAAATEAFEVIKTAIAKRGAPSVSKGKILVATVKGDIHDIGKNIVKTILENYGYTVVDLGRDVPVERVVDTAIQQDIHLIGLSALMTTTLVSMEETIRALRESGHPCKIWVGGAVLTPDYAKEIGADFYAKDAKESVDIAKKVLG